MEPPPTSYHLPNELWRYVIKTFILRRLELGQARPDEAFCSNRAALRELCLTSRRFAAIARPYLYETIVISVDTKMASGEGGRRVGAASLVLLMRTLVQNPELRPLVRNLALPLTLAIRHPGSFSDSAHVSKAWQDHSVFFSNLQPTDQESFDLAGLATNIAGPSADDASRRPELPSLEPDHLAPKVVAALLCMVPETEILLLQDIFTGSSEVFDATVQNLINHPQLGKLFLPRLKILQVQLDPVLMTSIEQVDGHDLSQAKISSPLLVRPELRRMDVRYGVFDEFTIAPKLLPGLAKLEEINVFVAAHCGSLRTIIEKAASLKSLTLGLLPITSSTLESSEPGSDLNSILLSRADTLESLSLDVTRAPEDQVVEQLGPLGKLTCLPRLRRLEHLSLEPHILIDWLNVNTWPRFLDTLPPNLVKLTFRFVPEHGQDLLRIWARSGIGVALRTSRGNWQRKMPRLRHIHLQPLPFSSRAVEVLRQDLEDAGIHLSWKDSSPDVSLAFEGLSLN